MKILLAILLCPVLAASQCFAIDGGPWGGGGQVDIIGTYAGVLHPTAVGSNNLGLFSAVIPNNGLAHGDFLIFTGERTFVGQITGVGNPNSGSFQATMAGIPVVTGGGATIETLNFHADGTLRARIRAGSNANLSVTGIRLRGTAHVTTTNRNDFPPTQTMTDYNVRGFKQSTSTSTSGSSS
jgi:hypothetical protein